MEKPESKIQQMKKEITDLMVPKPIIYWADFLISSFIAWGSFFFALKYGPTVPLYYLFLFISALGFYRALVFTHELVHLEKRAVPGFLFFWHLMCGIPLLTPHFIYRKIHIDHHSGKHYGKKTDGEYIEFGITSRLLIIAHLLYNAVIPILGVFRFMIAAPLSLIHPKLRKFVMSNMSFMGLRFTFTRDIPTKTSELLSWYLVEFACSAVCWAVYFLVANEVLSILVVAQWYIVTLTVLTMNSLRALGATHWYTSSGNHLSFSEQILDSVSVTNNSLLTLLLCPVGTRYHALHHLFPAIPYHSLKKAHTRLIEKFPEEELIRDTSYPNLFTCWRKIWLLPRTNAQKISVH